MWFLLIPGLMVSQSEKNTSVFAGVGYFGSKHKKEYFERDSRGGASVLLGAEYNTGNNLFLLSYTYDEDLAIMGSSSFNSNEVNANYGRKIPVTAWLDFRPYAGISAVFVNDKAYYNYNNQDLSEPHKSAIGLPVKLRLTFKPLNKISFGPDFNVNVNSTGTIFSDHFFVRYNFQKLL